MIPHSSGVATPRDECTAPARPAGGARRPLVAVAVVLATALALGTGVPVAQAGPDDDKRRVERQLRGAKAHLDESSEQLVGATRELRAAEVKLTAARTRLGSVRGQLAAAKAEDAALAAALVQAQRDVTVAAKAVSAAEDGVAAQRVRIAAFANASYQGSAVQELAALLDSESTEELVGRAQIVSSVTESQRSALERLNAAQADVSARREAHQVAERVVAHQRRDAATNLDRKRDLERQASAAEAGVARLVSQRRTAQQRAAKARTDDLRRYRSLVAERERIERLLRDLAREQARRRKRGGGGGGGGNGALSRPVNAPITSPYGMRFHPILHRWKLHDGTDFGASCGTPIRAAASGKVISRYYNSGYGNRVLVSHGWMRGASIVTAYNHLSSYAVRSGERVSRGEVVGYVGTTGYSTGCHLHFMVYRNGGTVDPMGYL